MLFPVLDGVAFLFDEFSHLIQYALISSIVLISVFVIFIAFLDDLLLFFLVLDFFIYFLFSLILFGVS